MHIACNQRLGADHSDMNTWKPAWQPAAQQKTACLIEHIVSIRDLHNGTIHAEPNDTGRAENTFPAMMINFAYVGESSRSLISTRQMGVFW